MELAKGFVMFSICALVGIVLVSQVLGTVDDNQLAQYQVNFPENPTVGQNISINGQNYTFVNEPSSGYGVELGDTTNETVYNLKLVLQNNTRLVIS